MTTTLRKLILDNVEDDRAARDIIQEIQLIESRVSDREWAAEDRLMKMEVQNVTA